MTDSKAFGRMLMIIRRDNNISLEELSKSIGVSKELLAEWEEGAKTPNREFALHLVESLPISRKEQGRMLGYAGHKNIAINTPGKVFLPSGIIFNEGFEEVTQEFGRQEIEELKVQILETKRVVENLNTQIQSDPTIFENRSEILSEIENIRGNLSRFETSRFPITAPVILPASEDMAVQLVSTTSLERLEEYRSEESKWSSIMSVFIGALIGVLTNVVTGGDMTKEAWFLVSLFLIISVLVFFTYWNYRTRRLGITTQIFQERKKVAEDK